MGYRIGIKGVATLDEVIEHAKVLLRDVMRDAPELSVYDESGKEVAVVYWYSHSGNLGGTAAEIRVRKVP
jgi:hypothetical protein